MSAKHRLTLLIAGVICVGVLLLTVFPTRTYIHQRHQLAVAREQQKVLAEENARLLKRTKTLQSDSEIERIARQQYNLIRPGEEAYTLLPSAIAMKTITKNSEAEKKKAKQDWVDKAAEKLSFWN